MKSTYEIITEFRTEMNDRFDRIEDCYTRKDEFQPVQRIVYGAVALILTAVVVALVSLVITRGGVNAS